MPDVEYDRDIEAVCSAANLSVKGRMLPEDTSKLIRRFFGTEKSDIRVVYDPKSDGFYDNEIPSHEFDNTFDAKTYLSQAMNGATTAQPFDELDDLFYHEELGRYADEENTATEIPNPDKISIDGEIAGGVHYIQGNQGYWAAYIDVPTRGLQCNDEKQRMNDGTLKVQSEGQFVDKKADNRFDEIRTAAKELDEFVEELEM